MKIIFGIFTGPSTQDRKKAICDTWVKDIPEDIEYFFVYGDCSVKDNSSHNLFLNCTESYESVCIKTYSFYKHCYDNYDFDYILRIDDDAYLNVKKFLSFNLECDYEGLLLRCSHGEYTHHYGKCIDKRFERPMHDDSQSLFCCGGGYCISRKAVGVVVNKISVDDIRQLHINNVGKDCVDMYGAGAEDRMIGELLWGENVTRRNVGTMYNADNVLYSVFGDCIFHPVYPKTMKNIKSASTAKYTILRESHK